MNRFTLTLTTVACAAVLAACAKQPSADQATLDIANAQQKANAEIAKTRADAQAKINSATQDLNQTRQDAQAKVNEAGANANKTINQAAQKTNAEIAKADYDVAMAKSQGTYKVNSEKCETFTGDQKTACHQQADADYERAKADAKARLDAVNNVASNY